MAAATGAMTVRVMIVAETAADVAIAVAAAEIVAGPRTSRSTDRLTSTFGRAGSLIPLFSRTRHVLRSAPAPALRGRDEADHQTSARLPALTSPQDDIV